ncbi:VWA domain-containing protein [Ammonicoccus fulvus]|uniref:VWA domain-containing protein n=1 Tax=Ammonicoccus fulvus TaxID=3138240 RepID=A0ABZ3FK54_9ACTN
MKRFAAVGVLLLTTSCISIPLGPRAENPAPVETAADDAAATSTPAPPPPANYVLILDSSGSMKTADMSGGMDRMTAAREAGRRFVEALPPDARLSVVTYGDRTPEDAPKESGCGDVTVKLPLGTDRNIGPVLDQLRPTGWTPISLALTKAAEQAPDGETTSIVLVSDGEDSCAPPDPCDTAGAVVRGKPHLTISTLGVRASSEQLACIADRGNGLSLPADNAAQLARRLPALSNPAAAADMLSPQGVQKVRPGTEYARIREQHPDFPELPAVATAETVIRVIWRNCEWLFDDQKVLREIVLQSGPTIDGITAGDPVGSLDVLGAPVKTEPASPGPGVPTGAETRFYAADQRLGLAWKVTVADGKVLTIILCTCLPQAPCPPSDDDARRLAGKPDLQVKRRQCTADQEWAVLDTLFDRAQKGGALVLNRKGGTRARVAMIDHGGDCYDIPATAPRRELSQLIYDGQMCVVSFSLDEVKNAPITTSGLGPIKLGMKGDELQRLGYVRPWSGEHCPKKWDGGDALPEDVWLEIDPGTDRLTAIVVNAKGFRTPTGAHLGSTRSDVERMYAGKLEDFSWIGEGGYAHSRAVVSGNTMVAFQFGFETTTFPSVERIFIQSKDKPFVGGC